MQKPIAQCLKSKSVQGDGTQSEVCASLKIPKTVLLRHYVNFRLALRRYIRIADIKVLPGCKLCFYIIAHHVTLIQSCSLESIT